jgi:hypothetical protein
MLFLVVTRRLKEDKTYDDFRDAWIPEEGFGISIRVMSGQRIDDAREIVTVAFADIEPGEVEDFVERITESERHRHARISEVVEPETSRVLYLHVAEDDLSAEPPAE